MPNSAHVFGRLEETRQPRGNPSGQSGDLEWKTPLRQKPETKTEDPESQGRSRNGETIKNTCLLP